MADILEVFKDTVRENSSNRMFKVDVVHGVDVVTKIINPFLELYDNRGVLILSSGSKANEVLTNRKIEHTNIVELFERKVNGDGYKLKEDVPSCSLIILWSVNYTQIEYIYELYKSINAVMVTIGDSFIVDYFSGGEITKFIYYSDYYMDSVDNVRGHSQQLIHFANRVRNGTEDKLETKDHRSYGVTTKPPSIEDLFEYDVAICNRHTVGKTNRKIRRYLYDTDDAKPMTGDRMVAYEMIQGVDKIGDEYTIEIGEELVVEKVDSSVDGMVYCYFNHNGQEISIMLNMKWISRMYGSDGVGYSNKGRMMFYSYVLPPELVVDKSYESVLFDMRKVRIGDMNTKRALYSIIQITRKQLEVVIDGDDPYLH